LDDYWLTHFVSLDSIELAAGAVPEDVTHVTVTPLASLPDAVSVEVEPLSTSDWESLEVNAELLEEGGLLQQVSVVYPNQLLSLRVALEMVRVRVTAETPSRLVANTEVHIRPKPRPPISTTESPLLRVVPSWDDFTTDMQELAVQTQHYSPIDVSPCTLVLHPTTLEQCGLQHGSVVVIRNYKLDGTQTSNVSQTAVARVTTSDLIPEGSVGE
jgi:hypothetical protein